MKRFNLVVPTKKKKDEKSITKGKRFELKRLITEWI